MLGILSLGVCVACISCLCCLCTAAVVAAPGLIDLRTGLLLCGRQRCEEPSRRSEEIFALDPKRDPSVRSNKTIDGTESESCPCAVTYVLDPVVQPRNAAGTCDGSARKRRHCRCPSFLDLVGDGPGSPGKVLPRA